MEPYHLEVLHLSGLGTHELASKYESSTLRRADCGVTLIYSSWSL